jgi:hypothetical protein
MFLFWSLHGYIYFSESKQEKQTPAFSGFHVGEV